MQQGTMSIITADKLSPATPEGRGREAVATAPQPAPSPLPPCLVAPVSGWYLVGKQTLDFTLALLLLVVTAPVMLLAMLLVKLTSRGPALYTQTRVGKNGRPFVIYKLRTMVNKCESLTGACWATPNDPRITLLGRILRKTHIDELPQLWNVLKGDMSLIGPRPERPEFVPRLEQAIGHYRSRLLMKPGVTGLAQVQLPPDTDLTSVRLKLAYDLYYVQHATLWLDVRLLAATACKMAALPFRVLRAMFRFPRQDAVEQEYKKLTPTPAVAGHASRV